MDIGSMINSSMSTQDRTRTQMQVDTLNNALIAENDGRVPKSELGKDDFLKLLITQLSHQDPTKPMEDTQFIAQMAQFSSLEQMTNMSSGFAKLGALLTGSEASSAVGRNVDVEVGEALVSGKITAATRGDYPQVRVDGNWYDWSSVKTVYADNGGTTL